MDITLRGDEIGRAVGADGGGWASQKRAFRLARIQLLRIGCPRDLEATAENRRNTPIVVTRNTHKLGLIQATGYYPERVVVCGGSRRAGLLSRGVLTAWGWVESGIPLEVEDSITAGALCERLQTVIVQRCYGGGMVLAAAQVWPNLVEVRPYEGTVVYAMGGDLLRQAFVIEGADGVVRLDGQAVKIDACGGGAMGMPRVDTGLRTTSNRLPLAGNQVSSRGGLTSELMTQVVRNYAQIDGAVEAMLAAMKTGLYRPMKPSFAPVPLTADGHILQPLAAAGIASVDFARWSDTVEARKFSTGQRSSLARKGYAMKDGSFPIVSTGDLGNAVKAFGRAPGNATKTHIIKRAKALGATHLLPEKWGVGGKQSDDIESFGHFQNSPKDAGNPKRGAFRA